MREHKYRAYCFDTKRMVYNVIPVGNKIYQTDGMGYFAQLKNSEIMEYPGLKDKRNREIYEGDIILIASYLIGEVIFSQGAFTLKMKDRQYNILDRFYSWSKIEVIGNIYQNPELLK